MKIGIYIHIPFCKSKCRYCSFISFKKEYEEILIYIDKLCQQIKRECVLLTDRLVQSIYIGGGTPSVLETKEIERLFETIFSCFKVDKACEITIEANPCSVTKEKLACYKKVGINRTSFGVQSLNDERLNKIGRAHDKKTAINAIKMAKEAGFDNISCDLLIGIPGQTMTMLKNDIQTLASLGVKHLSCYMLMLEEGTPLFDDVKSKRLNVASEDESVNMYECSYSLLKSLGFKRYEISNFSRGGYESKHNKNYWQMGEYIGFGMAAHSFLDGIRYEGIDGFKDYYDYVEKLKEAKNAEKILKLRSNFFKNTVLSQNEKIEEIIMLGLRTCEGIDLKRLLDLGYDLLKEKAEIIEKMKQKNMVHVKNNRLFITENYFGVSNQIILELLP